MKELYYWNHTHQFKMTYHGVPTIASDPRTAVEIRALLPAHCIGFVDVKLTKEKGHAGSARVLVYR
jgi:hypothetical protein